MMINCSLRETVGLGMWQGDETHLQGPGLDSQDRKKKKKKYIYIYILYIHQYTNIPEIFWSRNSPM
jgi:hypothetical protein